MFVLTFEGGGSVVTPARRLFDGLKAREGGAATSELTIAELLAPAKNERAMSVAQRRRLYLRLFEDGFIDLVPITRAILLDTVAVREAHPQKLADAIHIATALSVRARFFASFDRDARRLPQSLLWTPPTHHEVTDVFRVLNA